MVLYVILVFAAILIGMAISVLAFGTGGKRSRVFQDIYFTVEEVDGIGVLKGYDIPYYKEAENMVVKLHKVMFRSHSIGWDIAITENGPVIIEGNDRWEISLIQAVHGGMGYLEKYF